MISETPVNPSVTLHCCPAHCGHIQEISCKSFQAISQALTLGNGPTAKHQSVSDSQGLVLSRTFAKQVFAIQKCSNSFISKQSSRIINN